MNKLDAIFSPKSVAVVGASSQPGKVGHDIFKNILWGGYTGTLYPVNPKAKSILCVKSLPSLLDIEDMVDLAMLILPPQRIVKAVEDCIKKGIKGIVVVSAGFREVGKEGLKIENRITAMCMAAGIRLVGPNCLGVINPHPSISLNASFSARMPAVGNISFISQSGALCTAVLDFAADRGFGFSKFISIGNKADVDEFDLLRYYHHDPDTDVIMVYMEELRICGQAFIDEIKSITSGDNPTPVLVIKSGKTSAGAAAASSHTGAIAGTEAVYDAIFEEAGIIRVETVNELFDYAEAFIPKKIPRSNGIAIVTNAGGPGIVATDMTEAAGLKLAKLGDETVKALQSHLPATANIHNPIDVIGDASMDRYEMALDAVIKDENVDGAMVILTPQSMTDVTGTAEAVVKIAERTSKPVVCSFMGIFDVSAGVKILQKHHIPTYTFPENAAKALGILNTRSKWLNRQILAQYEFKHDKKKARGIIKGCFDQKKMYLGELDGLEVLKSYGFNTLTTILAKDEEEAAKTANNIGYPVVMKIVSPQIIHKSDAGGVKVGLKNEDEVKTAFKDIIENANAFNPDAVINGVLIQKMAEPGHEVILGMNRYPIFGPLIMFGMGGIFVEIFKDVVFRIAPIGRNNAQAMIKSVKVFPMLDGFRGSPKADIETLQKMIVSLSDLVLDNPEIRELDINPLLVHEEGHGVTVADVRIILSEPDPKCAIKKV
ncbi:MAG: acetate--CoA ligase family protein [Deltaproteobacteria bacterium]|nr:acetate--CoA ligase family protein [Deltaproteobacteria bacterium]